MPTETTCPHCRQTLTVPDSPRGRLAKCAHCDAIFPLDAPRPAEEASDQDRTVAAPGRPETLPSTAAGRPATSDEANAPRGEAPERQPAASPPPSEASALRAPEGVSGGGKWFLRIPEGRTFGPVDRFKLDRWFDEGRIDSDCWLREGESGDWAAAEAVYAALASPGSAFDAPGVRRAGDLPDTTYNPRPQGFVGARPAPSANPVAGTGIQHGTATGSHGTQPHAGVQPVRRTATSDSYAPSPYAANPNATGSPFRGAYAQPHRGEIVFLLGLFGMLLGCPVFSGAAWYLGGADLRAMNLGLMNPAGRGMTTFGYVLGIVVSCFWIVALLIGMLAISISILAN